MSVNPKNSVSAVIPKITATAFDAIARHVFPDVSGAVGHRNSGVTKLKFSGCCAIHARIARAAYSANDSSRTSSSYAPSSRASASRVTVRVTVRVRSQPAASNAVTAPRAARARRRAVAAPLDARATLEVARARIVAPHRVDVVAIRRDVRYSTAMCGGRDVSPPEFSQRRVFRTSQPRRPEHGGILDHENTAVFSCLDHVHGENRRSLVSF